MNYRSAVAEAKKLIKRSEEDQWRLAELTHEVIASGKSQREWAGDIGWKSNRSSAIYERIWKRWGHEDHGRRPAFADAYSTVLKGSDELLTTSERARIERERQVPTRHEDKVEMAQRLLSEPDIVEEVVQERSVREPILDALAQPTSQGPAREPRPRDANIAALAQIARAHDQMEAANDSVDADHISETQRAKAEVMLRALESEIEVWRVNVGGEISDKALARFMEEGD